MTFERKGEGSGMTTLLISVETRDALHRFKGCGAGRTWDNLLRELIALKEAQQ